MPRRVAHRSATGVASYSIRRRKQPLGDGSRLLQLVMPMTKPADFGLIGLAVMGENLALNIESRGNTVAVFNRTVEKVDEFIAGRAAGKRFVGCHSLGELVKGLAAPRK